MHRNISKPRVYKAMMKSLTKKIFWFSVLFVLGSWSLRAQSNQYVQVFEYIPDIENVGSNAKRVPLSNVEVTAAGAGSVVTGRNGVCKLKFKTKNHGDELRFRRVYKSGYEMLNPMQLNNNFVIHSNNDTIRLVMITTENQARRTRLFAEFAETQYTKQLEAEKQKLDQLSEQYESKLKEIELQYQEKLDNVENYIETLLRMDFTTLSGQGKMAVELYVQGEFDKAVATVESLNLIELYRKSAKASQDLEDVKSKIKNEQRIQRAQSEALKTHLYNQLTILIIEGSNENLKKAMRILEKMLDVDPTGIYEMNMYMGLCLDTKYYAYADSALRQRLMKPNLTPAQNVRARANLSHLLMGQMRYQEARHYMATSEHMRDSLIACDSTDMLLWFQKMCCHQMTAECMFYNGEFPKALKHIKKSYDAYLHLRPLDQDQMLYMNHSYVTLGRNIDMLIDMGEEKLADSIYQDARTRVGIRYQQNTLKARYLRMSYRIHHADLIMQQGQFEEAFAAFESELPEMEYIYSMNPMLVDELYLRMLTSLREYYKLTENHDKVYMACQRSERIYDRMLKMEAEINYENNHHADIHMDSIMIMKRENWLTEVRYDLAESGQLVDASMDPYPIYQSIVDMMESWDSLNADQYKRLEACRRKLQEQDTAADN